MPLWLVDWLEEWAEWDKRDERWYVRDTPTEPPSCVKLFSHHESYEVVWDSVNTIPVWKVDDFLAKLRTIHFNP